MTDFAFGNPVESVSEEHINYSRCTRSSPRRPPVRPRIARHDTRRHPGQATKMADMRRTALAGLLALMSLTVIGAAAPPAEDAETVARAVTADLAARAFDKVAARFDARMHEALSVDKLGALWDQINRQAGPFKTIASARVVTVAGFDRVELTCTFEKTSLVVSIVLNQQSMISGLFISAAT